MRSHPNYQLVPKKVLEAAKSILSRLVSFDPIVAIGPLVNEEGLCIEWADQGIFCDLTETEFEIDHLKFNTKGAVEHSVESYLVPEELPAGIAFLQSLLTKKVSTKEDEELATPTGFVRASQYV